MRGVGVLRGGTGRGVTQPHLALPCSVAAAALKAV